MMKMKENKGITLIALIITIIVLLILAGITINSITGNESAMEKATQAREENKLGEELEQIKLCVVNAIAQGLDAKVSDSNLRVQLNGIIAQSEIEKITGAGPWIIQGNSGREYKITNGGLVNAIDTMDKAIINAISVEERAKVPIIISNGDNIEEIKSCTIADTSIATVTKDTDGLWKITGGSISGDALQLTTTMTIEGKSGKKIENITVTLLKVTTAKDIIPVPTSSATSPYVKYAMNGQTEDNAEMCRVLYNDNEHGLQIITASTVDDNVILGKNDNIGATGSSNLEKAQNSYNNAIENLNKHAEKYINKNDTISIDARCVGSVSTITNGTLENKNDGALLENTNNYDYLQIFVDNEFKGSDFHMTNETDWAKLQTLGIRNATKKYWLASRNVNSNANSSTFFLFYTNNNGQNSSSQHLFSTDGSFFSVTNGLRPVFLINPTAKIKSGIGTEQDPYILEAGE